MDQRRRVPQTTAPRGDVLASASIPKFPARILQSSFPPISQAATSSSEAYHKHTFVSIYCCEDTSSCIPCGHAASSNYKYTMRTLADQRPDKKVKLLRKKNKNKFCSWHLWMKGRLQWKLLCCDFRSMLPTHADARHIIMDLHNTAYHLRLLTVRDGFCFK